MRTSVPPTCGRHLTAVLLVAVVFSLFSPVIPSQAAHASVTAEPALVQAQQAGEPPALEAVPPAAELAPAAAAAPDSPAIDCNAPPMGRQARLRAENEIAYAFRESGSKNLRYGRTNYINNGLAWDYDFPMTSPSYLTDITWPTITSADLDGNGTPEAVMAYRDKDGDLGMFVQKANGYDIWYSNGSTEPRHDGSISWLDIAGGNLNGPWGDASEEVVVAFRDDSDDLHLVVNDGDASANILANNNYFSAYYWQDNYGKGNVHYTTVATGDIDGDGYDNEIVVALQDSEDDLQVLIFRWYAGQGWLTQEWWNEWLTEGRDKVAYGIDVARGLDVTTGDIDGDFQDEIILGFADKDHKIQAFVLDNTNGKNTTALAFGDPTYVRLDAAEMHPLDYYDAYWPRSVSVAAGDVDGNGKDEIGLSYTVEIYDDSRGTYYTYLHFFTYAYTRPGLNGLTRLHKNYGGYGGPGYELDSYGRQQIAMGDIDLDGRAELAVTVRDYGGNLTTWVYASEGEFGWAGTANHVCNNCDVNELAVTMADFNGDTSYANYVGNQAATPCRAVTDTELTALVRVPPNYSAYNRATSTLSTGSYAEFGASTGSGTTAGTTTSVANSGSLTMDLSASFADIVEVGPSFSYSFEKALEVSDEQSVMRTDSLSYTSLPDYDTFDFVLFDQVTYWVYPYKESRSNSQFEVRIPKSVSHNTRTLDDWYSTGPSEFANSWVPVGMNLALGRTASQSSTYSTAVASRAVDGNVDGAYTHNSVAHTFKEANAYWQVDLGRVQHIDAVQLWNRTDTCCSANQFNRFSIFVTNTDPTGRTYSALHDDPTVWEYYVSGTAGRPSTVPVGTTGRYVRVQISDTNYLNIAEVKVWGYPGEVGQWPVEQPQTVSDGTFKVKLPDGTYQIVNGELKWTWTSDSGILMDRRAATAVSWSTQQDTDWTHTTEESTAESASVGFEVKVSGVGVEGSYGYTSENRTSRAVSWSNSTLFGGAAGKLSTAMNTAAQNYIYSPYLWVQKATSAGLVQQEFLVLDYWVTPVAAAGAAETAIEAGPAQDSAVAPAAVPLAPIVSSATHPDPLVWYDNSTVAFTWAQPPGDPATVAGYHYYLNGASDTTLSPTSNTTATGRTFEGLDDGVWYLHVRAGAEGNLWSETTHRAVHVDTHPPTVTLALDPPLPTGLNGWYTSPVTATVTASDGAGSGVTSIETSTDGATWQPYNGAIHYTADTPPLTLWARATDALGHVSEPVTTTVKVDMTPPSSKVEVGGQTVGVWLAGVITNTLGNQQLVLGGPIEDNLSGRAGMNLKVDDFEGTGATELGTWYPVPGNTDIEVNWYYTATLEIGRGSHIFMGQAQDEAGNLEAQYRLVRVNWFPPDVPDLSRSTMTVSPQAARPGETVGFAIAVRNSGHQEAWIGLTDTVPAGLTVDTATLGGAITYDPATRVITWPAVLLWPGEWNQFTFSAQVDAGVGHNVLQNTATAHGYWPNTDSLTGAARQYFLDHERTAVVTASLIVNPELPAGTDVTPPQAALSIQARRLVLDRTVPLSILADADAKWMFLREWTLDPVVGTWNAAQESGWLPYAATYPWTLSAGDGVKYVGVWVADASWNISPLDAGSLDYTSLVGSDQALADGGRAQYRFDLRKGTDAGFYLDVLGGDADLYLWQPLNAFRPNEYSNGDGPWDALDFAAPADGIYLLEVKGLGEARYQLSQAGIAGLARSAAARLQGQMRAEAEKPRPDHPLTVSDPLSAGVTTTPQPDRNFVYLPIVFK